MPPAYYVKQFPAQQILHPAPDHLRIGNERRWWLRRISARFSMENRPVAFRRPSSSFLRPGRRVTPGGSGTGPCPAGRADPIPPWIATADPSGSVVGPPVENRIRNPKKVWKNRIRARFQTCGCFPANAARPFSGSATRVGCPAPAASVNRAELTQAQLGSLGMGLATDGGGDAPHGFAHEVAPSQSLGRLPNRSPHDRIPPAPIRQTGHSGRLRHRPLPPAALPNSERSQLPS